MEKETQPLAIPAARSLADRDAFESAVRPLLASLLRTATAILGDESEARDALQNALISAWKNRHHLRDPNRHDAWLARILLNECRMALRHRTRSRRRLLPAPFQEVLDDLADGRADFTRRLAERDAVERAFERLGAHAREVLVLYYLDDRAVTDIAIVLQIPEGTVKSRLFNARRALAVALDEGQQ